MDLSVELIAIAGPDDNLAINQDQFFLYWDSRNKKMLLI